MNRFSVVFIILLALLIGSSGMNCSAQQNILVMSVNQEFGTIDPARGNDYTELFAMYNIYSQLVFPDSDGVSQPKLAESWTASPDGLSYTFKLKEGVKFHDGSELTAEDVKFTMDRMIALRDGYSWLWSDIVEETTVDDPYTVTFHLSEPFGPFVSTLPLLSILNKDAILEHIEPGEFGEFGDYGSNWLSTATNEDAGSGPYMLSEHDRGREIVFERYPDYFEGWPHGDKSVDMVRCIILHENATVKMMVRNGELTLVDHYRTYEDYKEMDSYPNAKSIAFDSSYIVAAKINTKIPPTDDIHIRRMLSWAFDYNMVTDVIRGGSPQARGVIAPTIPGHNPRVFQYSYNLDKAREEMMLSKYYPDIPDIVVTYPTGTEDRRKMALLLQESLAEIGVNLVVREEQWGRITELVTTVETTPHICITSQTPTYPDPDALLYTMYHSDAAGTWMSSEWLQDPIVDQLIEKERVMIDRDERIHTMNIIQQIISEQCPDIFIDNMLVHNAMQDYVMGLTWRPIMSSWYYFHDLWFEK
jgi:peptide/nickel transport system substrate-binding protein